MIIIGVGHKARRGKDLVGEYLAETHGFTVKHFADALYNECRYCTIATMEDLVTSKRSLLINGKPGPEDLLDVILPWIERKGRRRDLKPNLKSFHYGGMINKDGELLQWWGTDFRRVHSGDDYWLRRIERTLRLESPAAVVISDLRFKNEAAWVKSMGGECWKVHSTTPWEPTGRPDDHPSEVDLDDWDGWDSIIQNEAPSALKSDLHDQVEHLLEKVTQ